MMRAAPTVSRRVTGPQAVRWVASGETPWAHAIGPGYVTTAVLAFAAPRCGGGLLKGAARPLYPAHEEGITAWERRRTSAGRPERSPASTLAGPAGISVKNAGGEVALTGMDASGACQRLTEVMGG